VRLTDTARWPARAKHRDYTDTFASPAGRRVLADLVRRGHMLSPTASHAADGMLAALESARREGERGVALYILGILGWTAEDLRRLSETKEID